MQHSSRQVVESATVAGVRFIIKRMSLGRRIELAKRVNELSRKIEFLQAGGSEREQIEAVWLAGEIDAIYLRWGLDAIEGLHIDGQPAGVDALVDFGPEDLAREALVAVKAEAGLSEDERKN